MAKEKTTDPISFSSSSKTIYKRWGWQP